MKMRIKQLREDEKGSGLVLTLMVLLVLSVLGIAIGTLAIGSYRLSNVTRDDTSAYYIAEAGAVAAYEEVQKEVLNAYKTNQTKDSFYDNVSTILASKNGKSKINFEIQFGSKPGATIKTEKVDLQNYTIHSTGEVDGKERTVTKPITVNWVEKNTGGGLPKIPKNAALLTQGEIKIVESGKLEGDIHTNSTKKNSIELSGAPIFTNTKLYHSKKVKAEFLIERKHDGKWLESHEARDKDIDFSAYEDMIKQVKVPIYNSKDFKTLPNVKQEDNKTINIKENSYFDEIKVGSGKSLTINPMGKNPTIIVKDLSVLGGSINIVGKDKITLVVTDEVHFSNPAKINMSGASSQLLLIFTGSSRNFNNINEMNANMIAIGNKNSVNMQNTTIFEAMQYPMAYVAKTILEQVPNTEKHVAIFNKNDTNQITLVLEGLTATEVSETVAKLETLGSISTVQFIRMENALGETGSLVELWIEMNEAVLEEVND